MGIAGSVTQDERPLPAPRNNPADDESALEDEPWIDAPVRIDYGFNVKLGAGVYVNSNFTAIDTCVVSIGARTMLGPNVSLYSGTHPLDPALRNGTKGPETGQEIHIGEDCWLAGNVIVLPGVTIGKGATIGAGSVVTKVSLLLRYSWCTIRFWSLMHIRISLRFTWQLETQQR